MSLVESIVIVIGLVVFEVVNSKDNAIFNANILKTMSMLWRKRFLLIGIIKSVFLVRFLLTKTYTIAKYKYLKNCALTSIGFLGMFMVIESYPVEMPSWVPKVITSLLIGCILHVPADF